MTICFKHSNPEDLSDSSCYEREKEKVFLTLFDERISSCRHRIVGSAAEAEAAAERAVPVALQSEISLE